jgi:hypothetical protein
LTSSFFFFFFCSSSWSKINFKLNRKANEIKTWIRSFFGSHKTLVSGKGLKKYYRTSQAYRKNLYLNPQAIPLFQNIIFEFLCKIAKCCPSHLVFKIIFLNHILKSFIQFKFLDSCIWIFKYRKYIFKNFFLSNIPR